MQLRFIGSGDAFGSGGRLNTCFHVTGEAVNFLIDCGASSLVGLKSHAIRLNAIQAIFITHFHADHFGGIPFLILDAQFFAKRVEPLVIVGPPGLTQWYERVMETAFPGSFATATKFTLSLIEMQAGEARTVAGVRIKAFQAHHGNPGGPFFSYRLEAEGRTIAYTGDTEFTDTLVDCASGVDLFVAEAYFFDKKVKLHLDLATLTEQLPRMRPKRVILTHMSDDMLSRVGTLGFETAYDGRVIEF